MLIISHKSVKIARVAGEKIGVFDATKDGLMRKDFYKFFPRNISAIKEVDYIKVSSFLESSKYILNIKLSSNGMSKFKECVISLDRHVSTNQRLRCSIKEVDGEVEAFIDSDAVYIKRESYNTAFLSLIAGSSDVSITTIKELPSDASPI